MSAVSTAPEASTVLLESFDGKAESRSFRFSELETVIRADTSDQVAPAFKEVEQAVARGKHAAGIVSYEAASGLNPNHVTAEQGELPLLWFGIFGERTEFSSDLPETGDTICTVTPPKLSISSRNYRDAVEKIRCAIARGETYQTNFTSRQRFHISGTPFTLYRRMCRNQKASYCAWIDIGTHQILSASPELFFALSGNRLTMKPMKGTAERLPQACADLLQQERLKNSPKEQAENLMIVDLVRNDLSMIAETGTVRVPALFEVETFPTVHQMTTTVTADIRPTTGLLDIFRALFPCGSVTGAPKLRTMGIIRELEEEPRGVYCGAIGYV
ncbi:MAG: chorismate-binding protein, partial [Desulfuromonadales bacterium]